MCLKLVDYLLGNLRVRTPWVIWKRVSLAGTSQEQTLEKQKKPYFILTVIARSLTDIRETWRGRDSPIVGQTPS